MSWYHQTALLVSLFQIPPGVVVVWWFIKLKIDQQNRLDAYNRPCFLESLCFIEPIMRNCSIVIMCDSILGKASVDSLPCCNDMQCSSKSVWIAVRDFCRCLNLLFCLQGLFRALLWRSLHSTVGRFPCLVSTVVLILFSNTLSLENDIISNSLRTAQSCFLSYNKKGSGQMYWCACSHVLHQQKFVPFNLLLVWCRTIGCAPVDAEIGKKWAPSHSAKSSGVVKKECHESGIFRSVCSYIWHENFLCASRSNSSGALDSSSCRFRLFFSYLSKRKRTRRLTLFSLKKTFLSGQQRSLHCPRSKSVDCSLCTLHTVWNRHLVTKYNPSDHSQSWNWRSFVLWDQPNFSFVNNLQSLFPVCGSNFREKPTGSGKLEVWDDLFQSGTSERKWRFCQNSGKVRDKIKIGRVRKNYRKVKKLTFPIFLSCWWEMFSHASCIHWEKIWCSLWKWYQPIENVFPIKVLASKWSDVEAFQRTDFWVFWWDMSSLIPSANYDWLEMDFGHWCVRVFLHKGSILNKTSWALVLWRLFRDWLISGTCWGDFQVLWPKYFVHLVIASRSVRWTALDRLNGTSLHWSAHVNHTE